MNFEQVVGQLHIKKHLQTSAEQGRIAHAQLFTGKNGSGTLPMALAYARHILCGASSNNSRSHAMFDKFSHPDLHFVFPVNTNASIKSSHPTSDLFLKDWREFISTTPYAGLFDWYQHIGIDNKQGNISVHEAQEIYKKMSLKSFEGGHKVMIIWMADRMSSATSNKLLKLIEEPPKDSIFILITDNKEDIMQTIYSRCQLLEFPPINAVAIAAGLERDLHLPTNEALNFANKSQGNYQVALNLRNENINETQFEEWFITWVRSAFKARGNKSVVNELILWSENIASNNRETLKQFLNYCIEFFRQALLTNYQSESLVYLTPKTNNFKLEKFAPFIHGNNILPIFEALEKAQYHIERNGNAKIILTDLSFKLTRFLHVKE